LIIHNKGKFSGWELLYTLTAVSIPRALSATEDYEWSPTQMILGLAIAGIANFQKIVATGDVIIDSRALQSRITAASKGIEGAIYRVNELLLEKIPDNSTVAILSIASDDRETSNFTIEELEYRLASPGLITVVDRANLDKIRKEQSFQMSGDVSDESAVSIGKMLGANIVITGSLTSYGSTKRLTIKALDAKTAQIVAIAREQF
jgi:TolB-like protein